MNRFVKTLIFLIAVLNASSICAQTYTWNLDNLVANGNSSYLNQSNYSATPLNGLAVGIYSTDISTTLQKNGQGALMLNANNLQYVDFGNPSGLPAGNASRSISLWLRTSTTSGINTAIAYGSNSTNQSMFIGQNGAALIAGSAGNYFTVANFWAANIWHHVCLTFDGTTGMAKLYADGVEVASGTKTTWNLSLSRFYIGRNVNQTEYWSGIIDNVKLYNYALSPTQVYQDVKEGTKLAASWDMENSTVASGMMVSAINNPAYSIDSKVNQYALTLNGTDQYANITSNPSFPSGASERTINVWAKTNTVAAPNRTIVAYGSNTTGGSMFIGQQGTTLIAGAMGDYFTVSNFWAVNVWHHLSLTYNGQMAYLYADGVLVASGNKTWPLALSKTYVGRNVNDTEYWNGSVDGLNVFSSYMCAQQVQEDYAKTPAPPTNLIATTASPSDINLTFTDNSGTFFEAKRSLTSGTGYGQSFLVTPNFTDGNLSEGTTYYYIVRATNYISNSVFTSEASAMTMAKPPTNFQILATTANAVYLAWADNSMVETGYKIERSTTAGSGYTTIATVAANQSMFVDNGLAAQTTYYYRVSAVYGAGLLSTNAQATAYTLSVAKDADLTAAMNGQVFLYQYDGKGRVIMKKVPGADWVYLVYDSRDRVVMTQDGNQRKDAAGNVNKMDWLFTKYDNLNRPILTGIYTADSVLSQAKMQRRVDAYYKAMPGNGGTWSESYNGTGAIHGYTNTAYPVLVNQDQCLTVNYYDNYQFKTSFGSMQFDYQASEITGQEATWNNAVIGQLTGAKVKSLTGYTWFKSVTYYDKKYRVVQQIAQNIKGHTVNTNVYDFAGKPLRTKSSLYTGQPVQWTGVTNLQIQGETLNATGTTAWTSGAASVQTLPAGVDGWAEFTVVQTSPMASFGLSVQNTSNSYTTTDYHWYVAGTARGYQKSTALGSGAITVVAGDVLRIERIGTTVYFKRNGIVQFTGTLASTTALIGDVALNTTGARIAKVRLSETFSNFVATPKTLAQRNVYDHASRMTESWQSLDGATEILVAKNIYNEIGQLIDKKLHSSVSAATDARQSIDYRYNIRGWLSSINNSTLSSDATNDDTNDLFGMNLSYEQADANLGSTGLFNGNISGMKWSSWLGTTKEYGYKYTYDEMNRLAAATSRMNAAGTWQNSSFDEDNLVYYLNGNIKTLNRKGDTGVSIDALTYTYTGNQLLSVTDGVTVATDKPKGFYDGNTSGNDYSYDWNGNMLTDKNKNITTSIVYNHLNLPTKVVRSNGIINYLYDATGAKLSQVVTFGPTQKNTEYIGPWLFENNQLQFVQHPEGRIVVGEKKQLLVADGTSAAIATPTTNVTLSTVAISGETYIKVAPTVGVTLTKLGISKIGNTISVAEGERYTFRVKGYNNTTAAAALYVQGNTTDLLWPAATLQQGAASEAWVESMILIPAGVTQITFGVLYNSAGTATSTTYFYINDIEIIKENALAPDYQYHLKDHLGNVRLTFTANPGVDVGQATYEDTNLPNEVSKFLRTENVRKVQYYMFDRTNGSSPSTTPGYSQRLSGGTNETWGLARSLSVMPGDKISAEVYAKYVNPNSGNTSNFQGVINNIASLIAAGTTSSGTVVDGGSFSTSTSSFPFPTQAGGLPGKTSNAGPKAYLSWLVFDKNYNLIAAKSGYDAIDPSALETGTDIAHDRMFSPEIVIDRPGYVYIVISNEETTTPVDVYFDDFTVTQTKSAIVQADDYYPFGLVFNSYSRENTVPNKYLYNGKELQTDLGLNLEDYGPRMYDPAIGRWGVIDPRGERFFPLSGYSYSANNPILLNDPTGKDWTISMTEDKNGKKNYTINFTGAVLNSSKNKNVDLVKLATGLLNQANSLFNQKGGSDFSISFKGSIRVINDKKDLGKSETLFEVADRTHEAFNPKDKKSDEVILGATRNGKEILLNEEYADYIASDKQTGPHEMGHTAGLKHPEEDTWLYFFDGPTANSPASNFMRFSTNESVDNPTGPTKEQIERMYMLYKAGKLNRKDNKPVDED